MARRLKERRRPPRLRLILASASPRRQELLRSIGLEFETIPSRVDEAPRRGETARDYVLRVAKEKALDVARRLFEGIVIAADTAVVMDGKILGKPADVRQARRMLRKLSGCWHQVLTALYLVEAHTGRKTWGLERTKVKFSRLSRREIDWYLSTGEFADKAGAYAIQGYGSLLIEKIEGDYSNVVGLPLRLLSRLVARLGIDLKRAVPLVVSTPHR